MPGTGRGDARSPARQVRRVVTSSDGDGCSFVLSDRRLPSAVVGPDAPLRVDLWATRSAPARVEMDDDLAIDGMGTGLPPAGSGGTVMRVTEFLPDREKREGSRRFEDSRYRVTPERTAVHPGFHSTGMLTYALCLEGEIWVVLDHGETRLNAGDFLIDRGTFHAWSNRSDAVCRMLFVLVDAVVAEGSLGGAPGSPLD